MSKTTKQSKAEVIKATSQTDSILPESLLEPIANLTGLDVVKTRNLLKDSVFKAGKNEDPWTENEVAAALVFCQQYSLNPLTKQIQFFRTGGRVTPYVGYDGWIAIANRQADYNGATFDYTYSKEDENSVIAITCNIHRKGKDYPFSVPEWYRENYKQTMPWNTFPNKMLRQKAFNQAVRMAYGISAEIADDLPEANVSNPIEMDAVIDLANVVKVPEVVEEVTEEGK